MTKGKSETITPTPSNSLDYFIKTVMGLTKKELDQAFYGPGELITPKHISIPLSQENQILFHKSPLLKNAISGEFDEITKASIKAAADLINETANQQLVRIIPEINLLDRRNSVSVFQLKTNPLEDSGYRSSAVSLNSAISYGIGSQSSFGTILAIKKCDASVARIDNKEYVSCVKSAASEIMNLFGVQDLWTGFNPNKDFYRKMNDICKQERPLESSSLSKPSLMYRGPAFDSNSLYCSSADIMLVDGKLQLPLLDKRFIERIKERGNEIQTFEYVKGVSAGLFNSALNPSLKLGFMLILDSKFLIPLWEKSGISKNKENINFAADIITSACFFCSSSVALGIIPAAATNATSVIAKAGSRALKQELHERYPEMKRMKDGKIDFILDYMLPCVITAATLNASNLSIKSLGNATLNAIGYFTGSSFFEAISFFSCKNNVTQPEAAPQELTNIFVDQQINRVQREMQQQLGRIENQSESSEASSSNNQLDIESQFYPILNPQDLPGSLPENLQNPLPENLQILSPAILQTENNEAGSHSNPFDNLQRRRSTSLEQQSPRQERLEREDLRPGTAPVNPLSNPSILSPAHLEHESSSR